MSEYDISLHVHFLSTSGLDPEDFTQFYNQGENVSKHDSSGLGR